jgi:hypothetical protein
MHFTHAECWPVKPKSLTRGFFISDRTPLVSSALVSACDALVGGLDRLNRNEDTALLTPRSSRPGLLARDQGKSWLQGWYKGHGELNRCLLGLLGLPLVRVSGQSVVLATTPWGSYCLAFSRRRDCNIVTSK